MNVNFCNGSAYKITDSVIKEKIYVQLETLFGFHVSRSSFPGPQPVSIESKDINTLKTDNYVVCEKTDGERYVLVLVNIDSKPMSFMVNRNNDFLFVSLDIKREIFEGSVFDGELIQNKNKQWNYIIHDCMVYNGTSYLNYIHSKRYASIIDFIVHRYQSRENNCFNIKTKLFYNYGKGIKETWKHISETTENSIDGLIFTPTYKPIQFGRQWDLYKWKMSHNTIDLLVKKMGKKVFFYGLKKSGNYIFKSLQETDENTIEIMKFLNQEKENNINLRNGVIIEFKYSIDTEYLKPYRIRNDKDKPNSEITINNTLKNINESLQIDDLI
jgi:hypothetical protein